MPSGFIPSCDDRADGSYYNGAQFGTPTPAGTVLQAPNVFFEEMPDSPTFERGEQATIVHEFRCDAATGYDLIDSLARGQIMVDSVGNVMRVLTARFQYQKGDLGILTVTAEGISFDLPPEEFNVEPIEFNPSLFRHPRYASVVNYSGFSTGGSAVTGSQLIQIIQGATNLPQISSQNDAQLALNSSLVTNASVLALAQELFQKIQYGFDTFYLAGFRVTYSRYNFQPMDINPGGYVEDPVADGELPFYFWSDTGLAGGGNIFEVLAATVNPQLYADGISWLRQSDSQSFNRTWFKLTSTWIGAPDGFWDAQIYGS